ncbi:hypothetical protein STXM2123_2949 [Streptomyces sp. F-3]|nr:hypothetical protein STXM2123_2949 [Streptomyces sp. F-3]
MTPHGRELWVTKPSKNSYGRRVVTRTGQAGAARGVPVPVGFRGRAAG